VFYGIKKVESALIIGEELFSVSDDGHLSINNLDMLPYEILLRMTYD
jgi:hypothetical protein